MGNMPTALCSDCGKTLELTKGQQCRDGTYIHKRTLMEQWNKVPAKSLEDTKPTNPKDRLATTRLDLTLFPGTAVMYGALAATEGDCKYGAYNYREAGVQATVYIAALERHMGKYLNGEWEDPKTKVPHLANAIMCIAILIDAHENSMLIDDRPPKSDVAGLLARFEENVKHLQQLFPNGPDRYTELESKQLKQIREAFREKFLEKWKVT